MLVLSRGVDQAIMVGDDIEIKVIEIRGDKVRLGIAAPGQVAVHRKEVYDAIAEENRRAKASQPDHAKRLSDLLRKKQPPQS